MASYFIQFYITLCCVILTTYLTDHNLTVLLNQWPKFIFKFSTVFPVKSCHAFGYLKVDKNGKFFFRALGVLCVITTTQYVYRASNCFMQKNTCNSQDFQVSLLASTFGSLIAIITVIKLYLIATLNMVVIDAWLQLKLAIAETLASTTNFRWKPIFIMVMYVRKQSKLVEKVCGPVQLVFIGFYFSSVTTSWIIIFWLLKEGMPISLAVGVTFYSILQVIILWLLDSLNAKILKEEQEVVKIVISSTDKKSTLEHIEVRYSFSNKFIINEK